MRIRIQPLHFNADPNPDPDPAHQSDGSPTNALQTVKGTILSLQVSSSGRPGPLRLYFEPIKLLNFNFRDSDPVLHSNAGPDPASKNNTNLDKNNT